MVGPCLTDIILKSILIQMSTFRHLHFKSPSHSTNIQLHLTVNSPHFNVTPMYPGLVFRKTELAPLNPLIITPEAPFDYLTVSHSPVTMLNVWVEKGGMECFANDDESNVLDDVIFCHHDVHSSKNDGEHEFVLILALTLPPPQIPMN